MALPAIPFPNYFGPQTGHHQQSSAVRVWIIATAKLPTRFGEFTIVAFGNSRDAKEHVAILRGDVRAREVVAVRVHSECLTGDVMGSLRCDCRDQLEASLRHIGKQKCGVVLYMRQEGRGIGLANKIRAYALQDEGMDTVEANHALGFGDDERDYAIAAQMLHALGVTSVNLLTNNPKKVAGLRAHGVTVSARQPHIQPANRHNVNYLQTKARKSGHLIDTDALLLVAK